jgi:hypothetical protein
MQAVVAASSITIAMKVSPSLTARSAILRRHAFEAMLPCVLAAAPLFWVIEGLRRSTFMPLGRDQGIFQYVGWALRQGEHDYVHIRDVNGPLTHWVHVIFQALGGEDTRVFHVLDVTVSSIVFTSVGILVAGTVNRRRSAELGAQLGWGLAAFVLFSAQYLGYGYWDQAQRESFFDWFMLLSVALQLAALASRARGKYPPWAMVLSGALSLVPWFGKLTYGAFTLVQLVSLLCEDVPRKDKKHAAGHFALGALLVTLLFATAIAATGSLGAYLRITFIDVPVMYRFIWSKTISDMLAVQPHAGFAATAFASSGLVLALVGTRQLARRFVLVGLLPIAGLASALIQRKAFLYHFHPVTAAVAFQWLVLAHWGWNAVRSVPPRFRLLRAVPLGCAALLSVHVAKGLHDSPHVQKTWVDGTSAEYRNSKEYLSAFPESDYFGWDVWRAADFLRRATRTGERVQMYGMDPYVLFLAKRLSATPYIYGYDLNADAALAGGAGAKPSDKDRARIARMIEDHRRDFDTRLRRNPPAAFVFLDKAPLLTGEDALADFEAHATATSAWFRAEYVWAQSFDTAHVWLRRDLVTRAPLERRPL